MGSPPPTQHAAHAAFAQDVRRGLAQRPKRIPSRYFYDDVGTRIFQEIMELEEYYLTACELEILESYAGAIAQHLGTDACNVIELGAGDGQKSVRLLRGLLDAAIEVHYYPIDISKQALQMLTANLSAALPQERLRIHAVNAEYQDGLRRLTGRSQRKKLLCFLGSNIGNFAAEAAWQLLRQLREFLNSGDQLMIGFDLKKDPALLQSAYDDPHGVTARFNLNLLARLNRELGANFELSRFRHRARFNEASGAMESWLVSTVAQQVRIEALDQDVSFAAGEPIHTEYSYKYDLPQVEHYAHESGFEVVEHFRDAKGYFLVSLWQAKPSS